MNQTPIVSPTKIPLESFIQLLPFFFEEIHNDYLEMQSFLEEQDFKELRMLAHKIKGSSASYGAWIISEKAKQLQLLIDKDHTQKVGLLVQEIGKSIEQTHQYAKEKFLAS